jgi:cell shape-determining protein MreC
MLAFSRFEELLPDLVSATQDLRQKITRLERRQAADAKSIEAKLKRIRALEEEVRELEELREENARLREENARLRRV